MLQVYALFVKICYGKYMKKTLIYIFISFLYFNTSYSETYSCMYKFGDETRLKVLKRQGKIFVNEEGDSEGDIFLDNKESIVITKYYPFMDKDFPQIIFVTHIDKIKKAFIMTGLKYPNPTKTITGECKVIN